MKNHKILLSITLFLCTGTLFAPPPLPLSINQLKSRIGNAAHNHQLAELKQLFKQVSPDIQEERFFTLAYEGDDLADAVEAMLETVKISPDKLNETLEAIKAAAAMHTDTKYQKIISILTEALLPRERLSERLKQRQQFTPEQFEPGYLTRTPRK